MEFFAFTRYGWKSKSCGESKIRYNMLTDRTEVVMVTDEELRYRTVNKRALNDIAIDAKSHQFQCCAA